MSAPRILVAGIGNIFLGDDAFGVEVAQQLLRRQHPEGVRVVDFGIRGFDLAYALMDDYDSTILVDALGRGDVPGTVYLVEPDLSGPAQFGGDMVDAHSMHPARVLELVRSLGGQPKRLYLVGCEPATFGPEDEGQMGLSEPVQQAVGEAIIMIEELLEKLLRGEEWAESSGQRAVTVD